MPIYVVVLSLRSASHDYSPLWAELEKAGSQRVMDTTWFVDVKDSISQLTNSIRGMITERDILLVIAMGAGGGWSATRVSDETRDWLARRTSPGTAARISKLCPRAEIDVVIGRRTIAATVTAGARRPPTLIKGHPQDIGISFGSHARI